MGKKTLEPFSGVALMICVPLVFLFKRLDLKIKLMLWYCLVYYCCWFYVRTYFRYIIPLLPILSLVLAYFITVAEFGKGARKVMLILLAILGLSTVTSIARMEKISMDPSEWCSGCSPKRIIFYKKAYLSSPYYGAVDWRIKIFRRTRNPYPR